MENLLLKRTSPYLMRLFAHRPRTLLVLAGILVLVVAGACGALYHAFTSDLPNLETLKDYRPRLSTQIFDDQGELIGTLAFEKRELVPMEEVPEVLRLAVIAAEDAKFYSHEGLDFTGILRALLKNLLAREIVQGGSTITQQVVKSLLLTPEKSYSRKIREAILAYRLERSLSKDEILYLYLNQIYFGSGAYGVRTASKTYFGHDVQNVDLAEAALLAGLPRAPSRYSPARNPELARERQLYVLNRMLEEGFVTRSQVDAALAKPLRILAADESKNGPAPYVVDKVRDYLIERYGKDAAFAGGLRVYTTVRRQEQEAAEDALKSGAEAYRKRHPRKGGSTSGGGAAPDDELQGALISIELPQGYVRAMVGGMDYGRSQFNRAMDARRQPGSAFKGLLYAAALDKGFTPASIVVDSPIVFHDPVLEEEWKPRNYSRYFVGPTTVRDALAHSRNVVTVKILQEIGVSYAIQYAQRLGIQSRLNPELSLALGTSEVTLLELVRAYSVFACQGMRIEPILVRRVEDHEGNLLEEREPKAERAVSAETAYLMTSLLQSVVQEGTGRAASALGVPCAGKTGTTNDFHDAWFIGYTCDRITGVWMGFDQPRSLGPGETGGRLAAPVWTEFMKKVVRHDGPKEFPIPPGIVFARVDTQTGLLAGPNTAEARLECFREGTEPSEISGENLETDEADFFRQEMNLPAPGALPPDSETLD